MEESDVLKFVAHKLKSIIISRRKVTREDELITQLRNNETIVECLHFLLKHYYNSRDLKSLEMGKFYRENGNDQFRMKHYTESVKLYTMSALYSPPSSNELSIAYANRSASLFYLNRYNDCINDSKLALKLNYPINWHYKIYLRAAQCYLKLGKQQLAKEMLFKVKEMINNPDYIAPSMKDNIKKKISEITLSDSNTESNEQNTSGILKVKSQIKFEENENFPNASVSIDKKYNEEVGRHVVANRMIKKGEILFIEKPVSFILVNYDVLSDHCHHCNCLTRDIPIPCKNCLNTSYCSEECLSEAWSLYHRWECVASQMNLLKRIGIGHLALKVLLTCSTMTDKVRFNEMHNLLTHFDKVPMNDLEEYGVTALILTTYLSEYTDFFKLPNFEESLMNKFFNDPFNSVRDDKQLYVASLLLKHILQLLCNAPAITKSNILNYFMEDIVASGIYPSMSMMNHSCDPNTTTIFVDQYIIIKAVKDILADEEIFYSYGPHWRYMETEERQEILENQFYFTCKCKFCTLPKQYFEETSNDKRCRDCDKIARAQLLKAQNSSNVEEMEEALLFLIKGVNSKRRIDPYIEEIIHILSAKAEVYMGVGQTVEGVTCMNQAIAGVTKRYGSSSSKLLIKLNTFADVCLEYLQEESNTTTDAYRNVLKQTEEYLNQMEEIADLIHGSWSKIYEDIKIKQEKISFFS